MCGICSFYLLTLSSLKVSELYLSIDTGHSDDDWCFCVVCEMIKDSSDLKCQKSQQWNVVWFLQIFIKLQQPWRFERACFQCVYFTHRTPLEHVCLCLRWIFLHSIHSELKKGVNPTPWGPRRVGKDGSCWNIFVSDSFIWPAMTL